MSDRVAFAQEAAQLRQQLVRYLEHGMGRQSWSFQIETGSAFVVPHAWQRLSPTEQATRLVDAEAERIRSGPVWALTRDAVETLVRAARGGWTAPLTAATLPAESGMLVFEDAAQTERSARIVAATWGPVPGQGGRIQLSWWSDPEYAARTLRGRRRSDGERKAGGPLSLHNEAHLSFLPVLADQLSSEADQARLDITVMRICAAAWYGISQHLLQIETVPARKGPSPILVTAGDPAADARAITAAIEQAFAAAKAEHGDVLGSSGGDEPTRAEAGLFAAENDESADEIFQWIPPLARGAFTRTGLLEAEAERRWPGIWDRIEIERATATGTRPDWCHVSIRDVMLVLTGDFDLDAITASRYAATIAALAAWRSGRHIAHPHDDLAEAAMREQSASSAISTDVAAAMTVPGVYLATSAESGLFAHFEYDEAEDRAEMRLLFDTVSEPSLDALQPHTIHLDRATIAEGLEAAWETTSDIVAVLTGSTRGMNAQQRERIRDVANRLSAYVGMIEALNDDSTAVQEAGFVLGRRTEAPAWPRSPDENQPTLWLFDNARYIEQRDPR